MKNKGLVVFLTVVISLLCCYYLSFTYISARVQRKATLHATDKDGHIDFAEKQAYLDNAWKKPVYNFLGLKHTYEEVKENELGLGLDLQGGMHVTLEVSPVELIKRLAGNSQNEAFAAALAQAQKQQQLQPQASFTTLFCQAYRAQCPGGKLSDIFATAANRARISYESTDKEIIKILDQEIDKAIDRAFEIIRTRVDRFGTSQPNIQRLQGTGRIQIELPGVNNPERVKKLLQGVAQLQFWEVYEIPELSEALQAIDSLLVAEQKAAMPAQKIPTEFRVTSNNDQTKPSTRETSTPPEDASSVSPLFRLLKGKYGFVYAVDDVAIINSIFARNDVKALLPNDLQWLWDVKPHTTPEGTTVIGLYPIKQRRGGQAALEGDVITNARQVFDDRGKPAVSIQMNNSGARAWKKITANNINRRIAITLDKHVYSAPVVNTEIPSGNSQITGNFTLEEAKDLANILQAGSLPAPVKIVEEAIIGPTLSKRAQTEGIASMLLGLGLVVLFMGLYYAKGGLIANLALLFNILFIMGILAQLNAVLTLPGIAGIVLTIGMSIDANVLIFERIREELKSGVPMSIAIDRGYQKAYSSIIDSNVTTFLTGAILYVLGQGPVRGFATTLMIGIVSSFFSAVFITRVVMSWIVNRGQESRLTFSFAYSKDLLSKFHIDFLKLRRFSYAVSLVFIGIGFVLMVQQGGLNLGVDFTGGRSYVVALSRPIEPSALKTQLADYFGDQGTEVKTYGANNVLKVTTSYLMQNEAEETDVTVQHALVQGIQSLTGLTYAADAEAVLEGMFTIASTSKVGATIAGDIKSAARQSIFSALIMIFLYILVRFRSWQFGLAAVIALFHDSLAVFASMAMARAIGYAYEVDQVFVAAILTVIGYSINDTVVIFDRIRERLTMETGGNFQGVANRSINETMSRTLITSLTTLIAVVILFVFGGEVLRGFSFSLMVGIIFGTYSSIFIATPLAIDLSKISLGKKVFSQRYHTKKG
ncbi:MAG: protein translocase subunit SecDF [Amoebophilaceae bacterium]|nr:protein translocase subunit SecDF [Amoebophilaceae bacterium]